MSDTKPPVVPVDPSIRQSVSFSNRRNEAEDWKLPYRSSVLADIFQTAYLKNHGVHELNPTLRDLGTGETALYQAIAGEIPLLAADRILPRKYKTLATILATLIRAAPVISNNRQGFTPSPMTIPLYSKRF